MTDGFTPDDDLRRRLRDSVPAVGEAPLDAMRPRFERARRRRRAAVTATASALASLAVVAGVLAAGGGDGAGRVRVADDRPAGVPRVTSTTAPPSTVVTTVTSTTVAPTVTSTVPDAVTTTVGAASPITTSTSPSGPTTPTSVPPPTSAPGGTQVVDGEGGSVTVTWTLTTLLVDAVTPAPGWEPGEVDRKEATRVVVHFRRVGGSSGPGSGESTLDLRVERGELRVG